MLVARTLRPLTIADAEAWARIRRDALTLHPLAFGAIDPEDSATLVAFARARIERPDSILVGAFAGDRLDGTVGLRRESGPKERHKAYLWGMYVDPDARRQGVARALLQAAIERARIWEGIARINLSVSAEAPEAEALYRDAGFVEWGREPDALRWQGRSIVEVHMALDLERR